jgi:hypothetical protein
MRAIKVTYRAIFEQPIGALNPMGLKLPGLCPVEIFGQGEKWQAREIGSPGRAIYTKLYKSTTPIQGMACVEQAFERRIEPWQIWGTPPGESHERMLIADEIVDVGGGRMAWKDPEDYTHIIHAQTIPPGARIPPAACGAQVNTKCFISTKANVEPSCKGCAEVWRREYRNK